MRHIPRVSLIGVSVLLIGIAGLDEPVHAQVRATQAARIPTPQTTRAADMFLKIEGIDGEATDDGHDRWIEVLSWSWGETPSSARQLAPGSNGTTLTIVRRVDKASPQLSQACTSGRSLGRIVVHARTGGEFQEYVIDDARVRSCDQSSSDSRPTETLSLNFSKVESSPRPAAPVRGTSGAPDRPVVTGR